MSQSFLTITNGSHSHKVPLDPQGTQIGRDPNCDICLDSRFVSKSHARIFQDPFGRWIVEDLKSHNGVYLGQHRIKSQALLPGQHFRIASFDLVIQNEDETSASIKATVSADSIMATTTNLHDNIIRARSNQASPLLRQLNEIADNLLTLPDPDQLYDAICQQLANRLHAYAAIVRVPIPPEQLPADIQLLASTFHTGLDPLGANQNTQMCFSQSVLNSVRTENNAVMAKSTPAPNDQLVLTIVDHQNPHIVAAAPVNQNENQIDVLYVDIPADNAPVDMFEFIEAVARQTHFAQKSLAFAKANAERHLLDQQLSAARAIQSRLTPNLADVHSNLDAAIYYEPAMWVGGDYCDVWPTADGQLAFAIGDVSGKGLPAAMIMSNLHAALRTTMAFSTDLAVVIAQVNDHLVRIALNGRFVTLFLGLFNPSTARLAYVNAGHNPPIKLSRNSQPVEFPDTVDHPLGIISSSFTMLEDYLEPDTGIVVVTDGITEQKAPTGEMFETKRLISAAAKPFNSAKDIVNAVVANVTEFRCDLPQQDDTTVFALLNSTPLA